MILLNQILNDLIALVGLVVLEVILGRDKFDVARAVWCLTCMLKYQNKIWLGVASVHKIHSFGLVSAVA